MQSSEQAGKPAVYLICVHKLIHSLSLTQLLSVCVCVCNRSRRCCTRGLQRCPALRSSSQTATSNCGSNCLLPSSRTSSERHRLTQVTHADKSAQAHSVLTKVPLPLNDHLLVMHRSRRCPEWQNVLSYCCVYQPSTQTQILASNLALPRN